MESELRKKIENKGMVISRMPDWAKAIIIETASIEHSDDYGACIAQFVREANEYRILKDKFFNNDLNLSLSVDKPVTEKDTIKFANGKQLNKNGGNTNGH